MFNALQLQERRKHVTPRSAQERVHALLVRFLTSAFSLKLEDLADEWFVSRGTLQNDMAEVRERLAGYQLTIETKPRYGMKLFGAEMAIRACLTDLLFQLDQEDAENPLLNNDILLQPQVATFAGLLHPLLSQYNVRLTDKGEQYLIFYCAVALKRISDGYPLPEFDVEDGDDAVRKASTWLAGELSKAAGKEVSAAEEAYLRVNTPRGGCRRCGRPKSTPTMKKRWWITSCLISTPTITTICRAISSCAPICSPISRP